MATDTAMSGAAPDTQTAPRTPRWPRFRVRRVAARVVLGLGVLLTVVGLGIVLSCVINDRTINGARGESVADVLDTSPVRTVVRFSTDDGRVYIPPNGVLYPAGLQEGQTIQVEYDRNNPDLVRVMGRGAELSLLPVGSSLAVMWVVVLSAYAVLRRSAPR